MFFNATIEPTWSEVKIEQRLKFAIIFKTCLSIYCCLFFNKFAHNVRLSDVAAFVKRNYKITSGKNQIKNNFLPL